MNHLHTSFMSDALSTCIYQEFDKMIASCFEIPPALHQRFEIASLVFLNSLQMTYCFLSRVINSLYGFYLRSFFFITIFFFSNTEKRAKENIIHVLRRLISVISPFRVVNRSTTRRYLIFNSEGRKGEMEEISHQDILCYF